MEKIEYDDMMEHKEWVKRMVRESASKIAVDTTAQSPAESDVAKQTYICGKAEGVIDRYRVALDKLNEIEDYPDCAEVLKMQRKERPIASGVLDYFPDALAAVAYCSHIGNEQHNPGETLHWDRDKSKDHADCMIRHYMDRGTVDNDGVLHSAKMAWRALALLQVEIEASRK